MTKKKVLIFPYGTEISYEIENSLINHKEFELVCASSDPQIIGFHNPNCLLLPYVYKENFVQKINQLINDHNIDFIIPAHDDACLKLSNEQEKINKLVIGQSKEVNQIVRSKRKTYSFFEGILPLANIFDKLSADINFPIFVKPDVGQGSINTEKVETYVDAIKLSEKKKMPNYIYMEYLPGLEYTVDCFSQNGEVLYSGPRLRNTTRQGIATISETVRSDELNTLLNGYAKKISERLALHGAWFFQVKLDAMSIPKLLEIGPRVSGSMGLNRARGVNFIELSLHQALGRKVSVVFNELPLAIKRTLSLHLKHNYEYKNLYIDFDDTLLLEEIYINPDVIKLIVQEKNKGKKIYLLTKNVKNNLTETLRKSGLMNIFDEIMHIGVDVKKSSCMHPSSMLIDDSFAERKDAIEHGHFAIGLDCIHLL